MSKLLVTGDSITAGIGLSSPSTQTYGALTAAALGMSYINTAVAGYTSADILKNIQTLIITPAPKYAIIMIGTNDVYTASTVNILPIKQMVDTYIINMDAIITAVLAAGIIPVILSPTTSLNAGEILRFYELSKALKNLCLYKVVNFIDIFEHTAYLMNNINKTVWSAYYLPGDSYHINLYAHMYISDWILLNQIRV